MQIWIKIFRKISMTDEHEINGHQNHLILSDSLKSDLMLIVKNKFKRWLRSLFELTLFRACLLIEHLALQLFNLSLKHPYLELMVNIFLFGKDSCRISATVYDFHISFLYYFGSIRDFRSTFFFLWSYILLIFIIKLLF